MRTLQQIYEHFMLRVNKDTATDCWEWQGKLTKGYGQIKANGKSRYVHRMSYQYHNGSVDPELTIDHLCGNKVCVNPAHLEQVTRVENITRWNNANPKTTDVCRNGHTRTVENTYIHPTRPQIRRCKMCDAKRH